MKKYSEFISESHMNEGFFKNKSDWPKIFLASLET